MKPKYMLAGPACSIMLMPFLAAPSLGVDSGQTAPDVFVGVDMAYGNETTAPAQAKELIDQVCGFTNLVIVGSGGISEHIAVLNETFQYAYNKGLSFMSLWPTRFDFSGEVNETYSTLVAQWFKNQQDAWGTKLLGYLCPALDESGGSQIDQANQRLVTFNNTNGSLDYVGNFTKATAEFESDLADVLTKQRMLSKASDLLLFTSDYALYWFDYKGGYDVVLAELGLNQNSQLAVALCRDAAQALNKQLGVIITYTGNDSDNSESGLELYNDMVYSYNNGAKYIVVFDSNEDFTSGILGQERLEGMQDFWNYAIAHPRNGAHARGRTALVLPYGYALAFRSPYDSLWGIWPQNVFPLNITNVVQNALVKYGDTLDIIYDEGLTPGTALGYRQVVFWNDTLLAPTPPPSPSPTAAPSPTPTATPEPIESPSAMYIVVAAAVTVVAVFVSITLAFRKVQSQVTQRNF